MERAKTLGQLIPNWPEHAPDTAAELQFCTDEHLHETLAGDELELVRALRAQIRQAALSWGRSVQLGSPQSIEQSIADGDLRLITKRWLTLALDKNHRRSFVAFSADSARTVEKLSRFVPDASDLPAIQNGGSYVVLFGGGPWVLEIEDVRERLIRLQQAVPVADVLFRLLEKGPKSTLFSLRQGFGVHNRQRIEFPEPEYVTECALWDR